MVKTVVVILFISLLVFSTQAFAQENEIGSSLGGTFTPGPHSSQFLTPACTFNNPSCFSFSERFHIGSQVSYEGTYARRFLQREIVSFYAELPVVGTPSRNLGFTRISAPGFGSNFTRRDFSSVFITPSFRAKFLPDAPVSPFASIGEGIALFSSHSRSINFSAAGGPPVFYRQEISNNTLAHQFGVGLDFKTPVRNMEVRMEVRDFLTGRPAIDFGSGNHRNNIFAGGGLVFHF